MTARPRIALVATGGTLGSQGAHPLDVQDYAASGRPILDAQAILAGLPLLQELAEILPVPFATIPSTALTFADWRRLVAVLTDLARNTPDLAGIVITHGTSTLEETAYLLRSPRNARRLMDAVDSLEAGRGQDHVLVE